MILRTGVTQPYAQLPNSCILASYALAVGASSHARVQEFFLAYCSDFLLPLSSPDCAEWAYNAHFPSQYNTKRTGFQVIELLHNNSVQPAFAQARAIAGVSYIPNVRLQLPSLTGALAHGGLLCAVIPAMGGTHAKVYGIDGAGEYAVDPANASSPNGVQLNTEPFAHDGLLIVPLSPFGGVNEAAT